jgi:hypothetical protein
VWESVKLVGLCDAQSSRRFKEQSLHVGPASIFRKNAKNYVHGPAQGKVGLPSHFCFWRGERTVGKQPHPLSAMMPHHASIPESTTSTHWSPAPCGELARELLGRGILTNL